jgi:Cd2+/Zn2+-exporting ATPase/Cu+-exporting ATPase
MDCAECTTHVREALCSLSGVCSADVLLAAEKAIVEFDPAQVDLPSLRRAVESAGYRVAPSPIAAPASREFTRRALTLLGLVFGAVLFVVVAGEWLGLFDAFTRRLPWPLGAALVVAGGYPVFRNVVRAAFRKRIISHTLMTLGALAALAVGEWATAAVVVFFMRIGDYVEKFTAERARRAVKNLAELAPLTARLERDGVEREVPVSEVQAGDVVIVRPGEKIAVDGEVVSGYATVNQATITGESMPVEAGPGAKVFAATFAHAGALRVRVAGTGEDTTFGRIIKMVEEAEAHKADVQRLADGFSARYLPVVLLIAGLTLLIRHDPMATAAVLVVACSCSFALATPVAMLASIGAAARRGLLIKGGKYLELLARADVVLIDKTGTLTLGRPQITEVVALEGRNEDEILALAACAEKYSEHPLAEAVRAAARQRSLKLREPEQFQSIPGQGVHARVNGRRVSVGNRRMMPEATAIPEVGELETQGKTLLIVALDGKAAGALAAADTLRPEVPAALAALERLGVNHVELLTGDHERTAASLAGKLNVPYRANLLPEDKIGIVKDLQQNGHTVVMVGDGVNDAPALAQADIGIAMGAAGADVAMEAGHAVLLKEDWRLVPTLFGIARRTMRVVKWNIALTAVYNLAGLSLAALGFLPPIFAAAAQSLPDLGILGNSSRLLYPHRDERSETPRQ